MSERKTAVKKPAAPAKMTGRQLSRHQREVRLQRIAIVGVALAVALVLLVPLYGYWREVLAKGDQPIAIVRGQAISTSLYARYLGYEELLLQREMQKVSDRAAKADANSPDGQSAQLEQQLLAQRAQMLPSEVLDRLIEGKLIRDEAARRGITATPAEVDAVLQREMSDYPLGGYRYASVANPKAELMSVDQARQELKTLLGKGKFLTDDEVRTLVLEDSVLRARVQGAVAESVKTSGEQVRARHILVETEDQAKDVLARLQKGEDFAALAKELSQDTSNKDKGGELGWFPRGQMDPAFEAAAFSLKVGETSQPVKTTYGHHVVQVEEKSDSRPYDESYVQQQRMKAFGDWVSGQKAADPSAVQDLSEQDPSLVTWASNYVAQQLQAATR